MQTNTKNQNTNHEGTVIQVIPPFIELKRAVMTTLLGENTFYESGQSVKARISELVHKCEFDAVLDLAIESKEQANLRHAPLLILKELAKHAGLKDFNNAKAYRNAIFRVCTRADDLTELLAMYWEGGRKPIAKQLKLGLAQAFTKFNEYALGKYNRDKAVKLKDVLFMVHAKPKDTAQAELWKRLIDNKLATPDTWEVALSAGKDKKETWTRLLNENKLGYLAVLRNLRNMRDVGVDDNLIKDKLINSKGKEKILPHQFIAAACVNPSLENSINDALLENLSNHEKLKGKTIILVDVSGSMESKLSEKSEMRLIEAGAGVAAICREICEQVEIFAFSNDVREVPARQGMALIDKLKSMLGGGTSLGKAIDFLNTKDYDRIIVITDEQSSDKVQAPKGKGYIVNIAPYKMQIGFGEWIRINGFSQNLIKYILEHEKEGIV
ncbi:MAG TPA: TROVE domain-containing protein [Bacteroidia bacterium]|nr:TROVE domain-containing protein [Bacteroidia bacterium]